MCIRWVNRLLARDKAGVLLFAPLQGKTAAEVLTAEVLDQLRHPDSVILWDEAGLHARSTAVLRIARRLGGFYRLWAALYVLPAPLRDFAYDWVARHRCKWFGRLEACRVPGDGEKERSLP